MFPSKRNQKQVAERLKGNVDYYNKAHGFRTLRFFVSALSIVAGVAAVPAYYYLHGSENFMNPGPISRAHAQFDCNACHTQNQMVKERGTEAVRDILHTEYFVYIDQSCNNCHDGFNFHAPNVVPDLKRVGFGAQNETSSCTSCHREHLTAGKMLPTETASCVACHGRDDLMKASSQKGLRMDPRSFPNSARKTGGLQWFPEHRPREGYTQVFDAFDKGHPVFQIHKANLKDPDTLMYNHNRHEKGDIPKTTEGKKLDCGYCHKTDASGMNFQKITFDANCQGCHALKFDPNNPEMEIPHRDPEKVIGYIRTLGNQYVEQGVSKKGMTQTQAANYARESLTSLAGRYNTGTDYVRLGQVLQDQVFYAKEHINTGLGALLRRSNTGGGGDAVFSGCAYCHEVSPQQANVTPVITHEIIFDRWLGDGNFNHAKHTMQTCAQCHTSIPGSRLTSDINIPTQESCTLCHNGGPKGVANDCMSCHHYHNNEPGKQPFQTVPDKRKQADPNDPHNRKVPGKGQPVTADSDGPVTLREMLLSSNTR